MEAIGTTESIGTMESTGTMKSTGIMKPTEAIEIRKIKPEEKVWASLLSSVVFLGKESPEYKERLKNPLAHSEGYEKIWGAFDGTGKMCSCMHVHDFTFRFDGHPVGMGGIGGVATLPECRTGGYIRRIFEQCLPDMKEQGMVFSFLYPFSFAFYRKFGYELCYTPNRVRVPVSFFKKYPFPDRVTLHMPGDDVADFAAVYETFSRDLNFSMVRKTDNWEHILRNDPYVTRNFAYLHRDEAGKADGYLLFKVDDAHGDSGNTLNVREMAWTNPAGLHALFGFIGGLDPQFENLRWNAPGGVPIYSFFPESYEVESRLPANGMNRIVNVYRAFELIKAPAYNGRVTVAVTDRFMPCNTGTYAVEWESGQISVRVISQAADQTADLETNVETLAQLVTGFITPAEARLTGHVTVNANVKGLTALFPHKNAYIMEHF